MIYTVDPGKGLITGLCSDVNRTKRPILRGLAARAPYFHNGAPQDLDQLDFYNRHFPMNLTNDEKTDLIAFLNSLQVHAGGHGTNSPWPLRLEPTDRSKPRGGAGHVRRVAKKRIPIESSKSLRVSRGSK